MKNITYKKVLCLSICLLFLAVVLIPVSLQAASDPKPSPSPKIEKLSTPVLNLIVPANRSSAITLRWNRVSKAAEYEIQRRSSKESGYKTIAKVKTTVYKDIHLENETTYKYRVRALAKNAESSYSKERSQKTYKGVSPPGKLRFNYIRGNRISISWNKKSAALGYTIYFRRDGGALEYIKKTTKDTGVFQLKNTSFSKFEIYVRAIGKYGEGRLSKALSKDLSFPLTGKITKSFNEYSFKSEVRIEVRKIGKSVYYIARISANPGTLKTFTSANPGDTPKSRLTSSMAKDAGALIAVNGDYYNYHDRQVWDKIIRNGVIFRDNNPYRDQYVIFQNGLAAIYRNDRSKKYYEIPSAIELLAQGAVQSFAFGPGLVRDGKKLPPKDSQLHPRTAVGQVSPSEWIFIVVDGRQSGYSVGVSYSQLTSAFLKMGCTTAYNLDGGGSSAMYLKGYGVINRPSDGSERAVSDIVYFH